MRYLYDTCASSFSKRVQLLAFVMMMMMMAMTASAEMMINPSSSILEGYWHNWCDGGGYQGGNAPCVKLNEIHPDYNVVMVSFMKVFEGTPQASEGIPTFVLDPEIGYTSEQEFIDEIADLNNEGRTVLISLGGADAHIELVTGQEQALADEIIRLTDKYGFDGLDIDLEQTAIYAANNQQVVPAALRIVKDHYRSLDDNFIIAMAPEFPYLTGEMKYEPYLAGLEGYYDWISPQFYNQGGDGIWVDAISTWVTQNSDDLKKEFIYYISDAIINGKSGFYQITHDKLLFGIPSSNDAAATGYVQNPQDLFDAFDMLEQQGQPLLGIMTWSINWDMGTNAGGGPYDEDFVRTYGSYVSSRTRPPTAPVAPNDPTPSAPGAAPTSPGGPAPSPSTTMTPECEEIEGDGDDQQGGDVVVGGSTPYVAGTPYTVNDIVSNKGSLYQCLNTVVEPWCSSDAEWAYEPGVGTAWDEAWSVYTGTITTGNGGTAVAATKAASNQNKKQMTNCGGSVSVSSSATSLTTPFGSISRVMRKVLSSLMSFYQ